MIYDILFKATSETMLTIAIYLKHLGARIGITLERGLRVELDGIDVIFGGIVAGAMKSV